MALAAAAPVFTEYDRLYAIIDPEETPYDSKYAARTLLLDLIRSFKDEVSGKVRGGSASPAELEEYDVVLALCNVRLGGNFLMTEENTSAEAPLLEVMQVARRYLEPVAPPAAPPHRTLTLTEKLALAAAALESCNFLSLLYSGWDRFARALRHLRFGKRVYLSMYQQVVAAGVKPKAFTHLDSLYTHTVFYMAQVYGKLGESDYSARYVEATLRRQLAEQEFYLSGDAGARDVDAAHNAALESGCGPGWLPDGGASNETLTTTSGSGSDEAEEAPRAPAASLDRVEWTRNAIRLCDYYVVKDRLEAAAQCLMAADMVLGHCCEEVWGGLASNATSASEGTKERSWKTLPETLQRLLAEGAVAWAKIYVHVLRVARDIAAGVHTAETGGEGGVVEESEEGGDGEDPFSTAPGAGSGAFKAKDKISASAARGAAPKIAGQGEDAIDLDDSDHEGYQTLLAASVRPSGSSKAVDSTGAFILADTGSSSSRARAATATPSSTLPFTEFLERHAVKFGSDFTFYGPLHVGSIACPGKCVSGLLTVPSPRDVKSFEAARDLFKAALVGLQRGLDMFVLDGFVSDHVTVQTYISKAYKYLAFWESDDKRAAAMHGRRVTALSPIITQLNPGVYLHMHKELSLEVASAAQEQFDHKQARLESRIRTEGAASVKPVDVAGLLEPLDTAIQHYAHFLQCYKDPRLEGAPITASNATAPSLEGAAGLDDGSVEAYLTSHFCIARLLSRRLAATPEGRMHDLKCSLERFQWIVASAPKILPPPGDQFNAELSMCKEMVALLPEKLNLLARGASFRR